MKRLCRSRKHDRRKSIAVHALIGLSDTRSVVNAIDDDITLLDMRYDGDEMFIKNRWIFAGYTPLMCAVKYNNTEIAIYLIRKGADVNYTIHGEATPVYNACMNSNVSICNELIVFGADVTVPNHMSESPLMIAACDGNVETCTLLLASNADTVNAKNNLGNSSLHFATRLCRTDVCLLLIEHGACIDLLNNEHDTPLHCVCAQSALCSVIEIFDILIANHANISIINNDNKTPTDVACDYGNYYLLLHILKCHTDIDISLFNMESSLAIYGSSSIFRDANAGISIEMTQWRRWHLLNTYIRECKWRRRKHCMLAIVTISRRHGGSEYMGNVGTVFSMRHVKEAVISYI